MRPVRVNGRIYDVPTSWVEGEEMITRAMRYHDGRGGNLKQQSVAVCVAYGMYGEQFMAADPTQALMYLLQDLCRQAIEYVCVNGHDRCETSYPGPNCPYCERRDRSRRA